MLDRSVSVKATLFLIVPLFPLLTNSNTSKSSVTSMLPYTSYFIRTGQSSFGPMAFTKLENNLNRLERNNARISWRGCCGGFRRLQLRPGQYFGFGSIPDNWCNFKLGEWLVMHSKLIYWIPIVGVFVSLVQYDKDNGMGTFWSAYQTAMILIIIWVVAFLST